MNHRFPFKRARIVVFLCLFALVLGGIVFHVATGTPSALGLDQISAICPVGALEIMLGNHTVMLHPLILLAGVIVAILLVGKAFCSWGCPVPWIQKLKKSKSCSSGESCDSSAVCGVGSQLEDKGGKRDGLQVDSRHIVLLGTLGSAAIFGFPVFCLICPIGCIFALFIGIWNTFIFNEPSWALLVMPVLLILELLVFRKWCFRICPIGALMSLISVGNKTLAPQVDREKCLRTRGIDCQVCVEVCPEELDPHSSLIPECTKCGVCIEECPSQAILMKALKSSARAQVGDKSMK